MKTSVGLRCKSDYVKKSGLCALYLRVSINSKSVKIPLGIDWHPELVNEKDNELTPTKKGDKICADYNLVIRNEIAKVNQIFVEHRLLGEELTIKKFHEIYHNMEKRQSFIAYMDKRTRDRYRRGKISFGTYKSHRNALIWLKTFKNNVLFADLTVAFIEKFESYLSSQTVRRKTPTGNSLHPNTVANIMKYIKAYINLAIQKDKIPIENPFKSSDVKTTQNVKEVTYLTQDEVRRIMHLYADVIPLGWKITIGRFLIACFLGMRISDIMKITEYQVEEWKSDKRLAFHPKKQQKTKRLKTIYLPLDDMVIFFLEDYMKYLKEARAQSRIVGEAYGRKVLRHMKEKIGLKKEINFHTGRHTFATNYLLAGGKITNLQHILGHSSINTTMIYAHIVDQDKEEELGKLGRFYLGNTSAESYIEQAAAAPVVADKTASL